MTDRPETTPAILPHGTQQREQNSLTEHEFVRRVAIFFAVGTAFLFGILLLLNAFNVVLLLFISVLFALFLRGLTRLIVHYTHINDLLALALTGVVLLLLLVFVIWQIGPRVVEQLDELMEQLPNAIDQLETLLRRINIDEQLTGQINGTDLLNTFLSSGSSVFTRVTGIFSSTLGFLGTAVILFFIGIFLAVEPATYIDNAVRVLPHNQRLRAYGILQKLGTTLQLWMAARFASMLVVGGLTWLGLMILGVPVALPLALLAGLLTFIPNIGPILAIIPATLIGLSISVQMAALVFGLYLLVQVIESYIVTPIIERRTVSLPPALTITSQITLSLLVGQLGLLLAAPLVLVALVLVRELYLGEVLHDKPKESLTG